MNFSGKTSARFEVDWNWCLIILFIILLNDLTFLFQILKEFLVFENGNLTFLLVTKVSKWTWKGLYNISMIIVVSSISHWTTYDVSIISKLHIYRLHTTVIRLLTDVEMCTKEVFVITDKVIIDYIGCRTSLFEILSPMGCWNVLYLYVENYLHYLWHLHGFFYMTHQSL